MRSAMRWFPFSCALLVAAWAIPAGATSDIMQVTNQAWRAVAITPSDTARLPLTTDAIYTAGTSSNGACTMVVDMAGAESTDITFSFMTPGFPYPFKVVQVKATGTTCTGIIGLYTEPH